MFPLNSNLRVMDQGAKAIVLYLLNMPGTILNQISHAEEAQRTLRILLDIMGGDTTGTGRRKSSERAAKDEAIL